MKKGSIYLVLNSLLVSSLLLLAAFKMPGSIVVSYDKPLASELELDLKKEAFQIFKSKCNVCHKKKIPLKFFL